MKIFLDTSSLFKLYHKEADTNVVVNIFNDHNVTKVFLSDLSKIEFSSIVWKKVRNREINNLKAKEILEHFNSDIANYVFIPFDSNLTEQAINLITKYGTHGLRTLDSLQLSTAVFLKDEVNLFITSDKLLNEFFIQESLPIHKQVL